MVDRTSAEGTSCVADVFEEEEGEEGAAEVESEMDGCNPSEGTDGRAIVVEPCWASSLVERTSW